MSSRTSSALAALLLAGCGAPQGDTATAANQVASDIPGVSPVDPPGLECAVGGRALTRTCTFEREDARGDAILTVRHPDGGFRRLRIGQGGAITAADGAVPAQVSIGEAGATIVAIGGERYRLPAGSVPSPAR